jgi:hypothetical protein
VFANEPDFVSWKMLLTLVPDSLRRPVGDAGADRGKAGLQLPFGSGSPAHRSPFGVRQHVFGWYRQNIGDVAPSGAASTGNRKDQLHIRRIDLLMPRDADRPGQPAGYEPLTERRAQAVTGIRHDAAKTHSSRHHAVDLGQGDLGLGAGRLITRRHAGAFQAVSIAGPALGEKQAQGHHHGHLTAGPPNR